jgi:excisionase family DNA binding protein
METKRRLCSPSQAAKELGVTPQTLLKWIRLRSIPVTRVNARRLILDFDEVLTFLRDNPAPAPDPRPSTPEELADRQKASLARAKEASEWAASIDLSEDAAADVPTASAQS